MPLIRFAAAVLALAAAVPAAAQSELPSVFENAWLDFDVKSFKAGEWARYRLERDGEKTLEYRVACVAVEPELVWIEEDRTTAEFWPGTVILCSVSLKDHKVQRAFWGKPGETGRELRISPRGFPDPGNEAATGTATVTQGKTAIKGAEHAVEKVVIEAVTSSMEGDLKTTQTIETAEGIPFPLHADDKGVCRASIQEGTITWNGKAAWKGGLVRLKMEGRVKWTLALADWGADAKATLRR